MLRRGWIFVPLLFLAAPSCFGQTGTGQRKTLSGYIRDEGSEAGIGSAGIELQNSSGTRFAMTYSGADGSYYFDDMGSSDCYIVVQHEGYSTAREIVLTQLRLYVQMNVYLHKVNPASAPKPSNSVSAHELSIPAKARDAFQKGVNLVVAKSDYRGAVAQFERAISTDPSYYEAYAALGLAQYKLGDAPAAETALRKSMELSAEKYPNAMIDLASLLNGLNRFAEAEPLLRKVIALDDSSWRGHFELAQTLVGLKRLAEAQLSAARARDLKPDNPQICLLLYNLHILADDYSSALGDADAYLKIVPSGPMADRVRRMREQVQKALQTSQSRSAQAPLTKGTAVLKIGLRLQDNVPFSGEAHVRLTGAQGFETAENSTAGADGATVFPNLRPGNYVVEASAPGFVTVKQNIEIQPDQSPETLFLIMKPEIPSAAVSETKTSPAPRKSSVIPRGVDDFVPEVAADVPCSLFQVLQGAGQRAEQLVNNLQKFSASERVEHFAVSAKGMPGSVDVRTFDYVALVSRDPQGGFDLAEYRNGSVVGPQQFPAGIATSNLSVHALIFHPLLASDFNFACEGLGQWKGSPAWLVHFEQKQDQPSQFRFYEVDGVLHPVLLKGRAWIDAGTYQVLRLESDLIKPVHEIHLMRDHVAIEYGRVPFQTHNEQLWLPQTADLYVDWNGRRFYRRHAFSDFKLFSIHTAQELHSPQESYCFTNTSDRSVLGVLTVTSAPGVSLKPTSLTLTIPARSTVCKTVGPGKDVNIPPESIGSATLAHNGPPGAVQSDAYLVKEVTLEIIPNSSVPATSNP